MLDAARIRDGKDLGKGELEARRIVSAARDAITTHKALALMNVEMKQAAKLDGILQAEAAMIQDNPFTDQPARLLDQAIGRTEMADVTDVLKNERKAVAWIGDVRNAVIAGARELMDGRAFSFSLNGGGDQKDVKIGKGEQLHVVNVDDTSLYVSNRRNNPHQYRLDSLTRQSRQSLSLLSCKGDKAAETKLKLKWIYCDLTSIKSNTVKISNIVDDAEHQIQDIGREKPPAEMVDALRPWILRAQNLARASRRNNQAHSPVSAYLPYITIWAGTGGDKAQHCKITVNGKVFMQGGEDCRGINVVAIDGEQLLLRENYDVGNEPESTRRFCEAIAKLPKTALVILAVWDDKGLNDLPAQMFGSLGGTQVVQNLPKRDAYYLIGMPGMGGGLGTDELGPAPVNFPRQGR
jgi:hypothetical protein